MSEIRVRGPVGPGSSPAAATRPVAFATRAARWTDWTPGSADGPGDAVELRVAALLAGARFARSDPAAAGRAVAAALAEAPDDLSARLAAYRLHFYNHELGEALTHAEVLLRLLARGLNVAADWRTVRPGEAAFDALEEAPSLYLQALLAWGYCRARRGDRGEGAEAIAKVAELDPGDRFGAGRLLAVVRQPGEED